MGLRWVAAGGVAVVLLAGVAVGADRWALDAVEDQVAGSLTAEADTVRGGPEVDITGFPFLTQLVAGSLDDVLLSAASATLGDLTLTDTDVHAREVSTALPYTARTARLAAASVTLPDVELSDVVVRATRVSTEAPLTAGTADVRAEVGRLAGVELQRVVVRAEEVTTGEPLTARSMELTGSMTTVTLEELVAARAGLEDVQLDVDDGRVTATSAVLGMDVVAEMVPRAQGRAIGVDVVRLSVGDAALDVEELPRRVQQQLSELAVPVDGLPDGLELTDVTVERDGVRITAAGRDVSWSGAS